MENTAENLVSAFVTIATGAAGQYLRKQGIKSDERAYTIVKREIASKGIQAFKAAWDDAKEAMDCTSAELSAATFSASATVFGIEIGKTVERETSTVQN